MIVSTMTEQEIRKELLVAKESTYSKLEIYKKKFRSLVLRSSTFPVSAFYECAAKNGNKVIVGLNASKRGQHSEPNVGLYCIYERREGKYAAVWSLGDKIIIYAPHFFDRYQDRILKNNSLQRSEVIKEFFKHNWGQVGLEINDEVEAVFKCFEGHYSDEVISLVYAVSDGYCFGENHGNVSIVKTIITENMLSDKQRQLFPAIRELFIQVSRQLYGALGNPSTD